VGVMVRVAVELGRGVQVGRRVRVTVLVVVGDGVLVSVRVAVKKVAVGVGATGRLRTKLINMLMKIRIEMPRMTTITGIAVLCGGGLLVMSGFGESKADCLNRRWVRIQH
jgi:hypothetical protein